MKGYLTNLSLAVGGGWTTESWVLIFAAYSILDLNAWIKEIKKIMNISKNTRIYKNKNGEINK